MITRDWVQRNGKDVHPKLMKLHDANLLQMRKNSQNMGYLFQQWHFHCHSHSSMKATLSASGILILSHGLDAQLPGTQHRHATPATTPHFFSPTTASSLSLPTGRTSFSLNESTLSLSPPLSASIASWLWT